MNIIGKVDSLWRYPVKSMCGEELDEAFLGFAGVYGDRIFAFTSTAYSKGFPYLSATKQQEMLHYRPRFRYPDKAAKPLNLTEAENISPGLTPVYANRAEMIVNVETPTGEMLSIDDPMLVHRLKAGLSDTPDLQLVHSDRAMTDCRPVSLFSLQTAQKLAEEIGTPVDPRRFRANIILDFAHSGGFSEDGFIGKSLQIGSKAVVSVLERDPRCKMITLDPDTGATNSALLRQVAKEHEGMAGVYCAVLVEGMVRKGDAVYLP